MMTTAQQKMTETVHNTGEDERRLSISDEERRSLTRWLTTVLFMIFCMVVIGGVTRLTGWALYGRVEASHGDSPPLTDTEWGRVFELYKQSPQYEQVNQWMTMSDFSMDLLLGISSSSFWSTHWFSLCSTLALLHG